MDVMMEEILETSMKIISSWDYETTDNCPNTSLFNHHSRDEVLTFMRAVKDLHAALHFFTTTTNISHMPSHKKITSCQNLLRTAKKRLSTEFYSLLKANSKHHIHYFSLQDDYAYFPNDSGNNNEEHNIFTILKSNSNYGDSTSEDSSDIADLKLIADCMMSSGFAKKCLKLYKLTRRSFVDDALVKLDIRRLKKAHVQKFDWETIEAKITKWLKTIGICMKIFSHEKILCEDLFSSGTLPSVRESCFSEVCKEAALITVTIPGKLAKHAKKSPERIIKYLKLYEGVSDQILEVENVFSSEITSPVRLEMKSSQGRIIESIKLMLTEFEASINKDANKGVVPKGGIHPWTKYVINYLIHLSHHTLALDKILVDYPVSLQTSIAESYFEGDTLSSPTALQFGWLILVLLGKLETKSELYKDGALSHLFLANNLQYIVKKVKSKILFNVLGKKWVSKHTSKVGQYAANYERLGWGRVASYIPKDLAIEIALDKVKDCFIKFNVDFEEEYRKQVDWVVNDPKLRDEIKASIARKVDARYRRMYDKYKVVLGKSRERGKIDSVVKFTPEDLQSYLADVLDGHENEDDNDNDDDNVVLMPPKVETSHEGKESTFLLRGSRRLFLGSPT